MAQMADHKNIRWHLTRSGSFVIEKLLSNSLLAATLVLVGIFSVIARDRNFFTFENLLNMLLSMVVIGLLTWALAVAMIAGNTDFSVTGMSAVASILVGIIFMQQGWPALPTILAVFAVCGAIAMFTSVLIVNFKIPSIVSTIAVNGSYIALAMFLCNNLQINIRRPDMQNIFLKFTPLNIPFSVWLMLIFFGIAYVMLYHTKLGAHIYAVGANSVAARLNGVPVNNVIRATLLWSATCVAMAAIIQTTRSGITMLYGSSGGFPPFTALTPVMLGGISLFGGRGRLENMLVAILFTTVLFNGLIMMNASTGVIQLCNGLVILLALIMSAAREWFSQLKGLRR